MQWNENQRKAIETRNRNILVSAAAGSGKTAVLVERIIRLIIEDRTGIDRLLVVTFTKAAASEMKNKIAKAIGEKLKDGSADRDTKAFLREQLDRIGQASISTFHSFAGKIIKEYYYEIGVTPDLRPAEDTQTVLLKMEAMEEVFAEEFEKDDNEAFLRFLRCYSSHKSESAVKEAIMKLYEKIRAMEDPFVWLDGSISEIERFNDAEYAESDIRYNMLIKLYYSKVREIYLFKKEVVDYLLDNGLEKMAAKQMEDLEEINSWAEFLSSRKSVEEMSAFAQRVAEFKAAVLRAGKDEKEEYEIVKSGVTARRDAVTKALRAFRDLLAGGSDETMFEDIASTAPFLREIQRIILRFHEKYREKKLEKNCMDFSDMEHYALEILKNPQIAEECRKRYAYIFIDEYQDSNYLQEAIISRIKSEDNLFMVGDLKQSIYSFRLAEPDIFRKRYEEYSADPASEKIELNQNFRCKKYIIDGVNSVFRELMDDYTDDVALHRGVENPEEADFPVELIVVDHSYRKKDSDSSDPVYKMLSDLKDAEIEAAVIADRISGLVGTSYYDCKEQKEKLLKYSDIVLLMRGTRNKGAVYYDVLASAGIPVYLNSNSGYFETVEVRLLTDLLTVIDNFRKDIPLIGVMYSTVFGFTIDQLMMIRNEFRDMPFHEGVLKYAETGSDDLLRDRCGSMIRKLGQWREECRYEPLDGFVWRIIRESGIYADAGLMKGGRQRQMNLRTFVDKTAGYMMTGENSIYGLLNYFSMIEKNVEVGSVSLLSEEDDTVQITTIHKSKGLEYPVVIVPESASGMTGKISVPMIAADRDIGIGLKTYVPERGILKTNILRTLIEERKKEKELEEEYRILYVAMTRAKDRLILTGSVDSYETFEAFSDISAINKTTYLDCLYKIAASEKKEIVLDVVSCEGYGEKVSHEKSYSRNKNMLRRLLEEERDFSGIDEIMSYRYPYETDKKVRSKYGVTELAARDEKRRHAEIVSTDYEEDSGEEKSMATGTAYHLVMEKIDFRRAAEEGISYIRSFVDELAEKGLLDEEEKKRIYPERIDTFFRSGPGSTAVSGKIFREHPFTMKTYVDGAETLVQGVIDCFAETEEKRYVLIDYKTGRYSDKTAEKYRKQIMIYRDAIEKGTGGTVEEGWLYFFAEGKGVRVF